MTTQELSTTSLYQYSGLKKCIEKLQENKTILRLINLKYRDNPEELELWLLAWDAHPTLKKDCFSKQMEKDYLRHKFVKELRASKGNIHS